MKRIMALVVAVSSALMLTASVGMAQSQKEGERLFLRLRN